MLNQEVVTQARLAMHGRILRCPLEENPMDCPLYTVRQLPLVDRLEWLDAQSDHQLVHVDAGRDRLIAKLTRGAVDELALCEGAEVYLIIKSQALRRIR